MTADTPERELQELFPTEVEYQGLLDKRTRRARLFQAACMTALTIAVVALATLHHHPRSGWWRS